MKTIRCTVEQELQHEQICDASGAIAVGTHHFVVANDEDNLLRLYQADQSGKPVEIDINHYFDNNPNCEETDLEAAAQLDGMIYWITSHGRNSKGKFKPARHQFFANRFSRSNGIKFEQVGRSYTQLVLRDMFTDQRLKCYQLEAAEKIPPKAAGGLNIEGLTTTPKGELLIGFRNPIIQGKALLIPLKNPRKLVEKKGTKANFGKPIELDLGGLGIRSIEYWEPEQCYLIVAGAYDSSDQFALYQWSGLDQTPQRLEIIGLPSDFRPEGILFYPGREQQFQLLSDDGLLKRIGDVPCKDIEDRNSPQKYFRSLWVRMHEV